MIANCVVDAYSSRVCERGTKSCKVSHVAEAMTLGDALPKEMARVRDEVLPYYTPEVNGQFAAWQMRKDLDDAAKALATGDVVAMLRVYESLKGWNV